MMMMITTTTTTTTIWLKAFPMAEEFSFWLFTTVAWVQIQVQSMWEMCWVKWHSDMYFSKHISFPNCIIHLPLHGHLVPVPMTLYDSSSFHHLNLLSRMGKCERNCLVIFSMHCIMLDWVPARELIFTFIKQILQYRKCSQISCFHLFLYLNMLQCLVAISD